MSDCTESRALRARARAARYLFEFDRREFLQIVGGGLVVLLVAPRLDRAGVGPRAGGGEALPADVDAWLHIGEDGAVTVYTGKAEVGQNIRTSLTQAVAEELRVPSPRSAGHGRHGDARRSTWARSAAARRRPWPRSCAASPRPRARRCSISRRSAGASRHATLRVADGKVMRQRRAIRSRFGELTKGRSWSRHCRPKTADHVAGGSGGRRHVGAARSTARDFVTGAPRVRVGHAAGRDAPRQGAAAAGHGAKLAVARDRRGRRRCRA